MTKQERIALYSLKGTLTAHETIHRIAVEVAQEGMATAETRYMEGYSSGKADAAANALEKVLTALDALDKILRGAHGA